jgi:hypothetical protein
MNATEKPWSCLVPEGHYASHRFDSVSPLQRSRCRLSTVAPQTLPLIRSLKGEIA